MTDLAVGLGIGLIVAILVYRNDKSKIGKMQDKIDELVKKQAEK